MLGHPCAQHESCLDILFSVLFYVLLCSLAQLYVNMLVPESFYAQYISSYIGDDSTGEVEMNLLISVREPRVHVMWTQYIRHLV